LVFEGTYSFFTGLKISMWMRLGIKKRSGFPKRFFKL